MGQNNSSPRTEKQTRNRRHSSNVTARSEITSRRATMSGAPASHPRSSVGGVNAAAGTLPQRSKTSVLPPTHTTPRANNLASPPPYWPTANMPPSIPEAVPEAVPPPNNAISSGQENALELLKEYDTVFLMDDSGSMAGALWREASRALADVARIAAQYDDDGIDIHFLNSKESLLGVTSEQQVTDFFSRLQPRGQTPTAARLESLLRPYISSIEQAFAQTSGSTDPAVTGIKPVNFIVITDGAPSDEPEDVIVAAARRLDRGDFPLSQLGIQFVQIGNDPEAKIALEELDDDLSGKHGIRDIVDTTPYPPGGLNGETLIKILLGGINKRVDKRGGASVMR